MVNNYLLANPEDMSVDKTEVRGLSVKYDPQMDVIRLSEPLSVMTPWAIYDLLHILKQEKGEEKVTLELKQHDAYL